MPQPSKHLAVTWDLGVAFRSGIWETLYRLNLKDGFVVLTIEPRTTSSLSGSLSVLRAEASSRKAHSALRNGLLLYLWPSEWKASGQPLIFGSYQNRFSHSKQVQHSSVKEH